MSFKFIAASTAALCLSGVTAFAGGHGAGPVGVEEINGAEVIVDANHMTLYTFDNDAEGQSSCYDACAQNWPPLAGDAEMTLPEGYGLTERTDGSMQITYNNQPLYLWINDTNPGDMTGDGVKDVWHVARP